MEVLNDTSDNLINLYRVAKKHSAALLSEIDATLYSQSDYKTSVKILKNPTEYTELERAWAYWVNIQQSFAKTVGTGWGTAVKGKNSASSYDNHKKRLPEILNRLNDVHISCEDALRCIDRWDSPQTLFYCDPPYINTCMGHYKGYTIDDYQALIDKLDNIKGNYILSNYPQEITPKSCTETIEIKSAMSARKTVAGKREHDERMEMLYIKRNPLELSTLPLFNQANL
jgi:DNA adenine methylase